MNAYSTANHTVKFTINTIDNDGFIKTIEGGENCVQVYRAPVSWAINQPTNQPTGGTMYTIEYTSHVSGGFGYHMDVFYKTLEADSIFDVLSFIKSNFVMDCDYVTVNSIFCGNRELDIDKLYYYVERFSWADWDYWHHPEDWE